MAVARARCRVLRQGPSVRRWPGAARASSSISRRQALTRRSSSPISSPTPPGGYFISLQSPADGRSL